MNLRRNGNKLLIFVELVALVIVVLYGALHTVMGKNSDAKSGKNNIQSSHVVETESQEPVDTPAEEPQSEPMTYSEAVVAKVSQMSTEEKVGQLFITRPEEITGVAQFTQAGAKTRSSIEKYPLGGFVFSEGNFGGIAATQKMMENIQNYATERIGIPMLLAVNEAGGEQSPLATKNAYELQANPIDWNGVDDASDRAASMASYIGESGLNMNMSLVANTTEAVAGDESNLSFGSDASSITEMVSAVVGAYNNAGMSAVVKTFPGAGVTLPDEQLKPFKGAVDAGAGYMMIGTDTCESITGDESLPCCLSSKAVQYIRGTIGFKGVIMTTDLSAGVTEGVSQEDAAVTAINAGASMIYVTTGFESTYARVLEAVNGGEISQEAIDDAVSRILTAKGV